MKIAIIGTRGIPNNYGGFEQLAQYLSVRLVEKGHEIYVYNSHDHPYRESSWNNVKLIHCYDAEKKLGTAGQFIYDLNCILDSRKRNFDVILALGYTSFSLWAGLLPRRSLTLINMDGLEWKRTKYSKPIQRYLRFAERLAVKYCDGYIADSLAIQAYLKEKYDIPSQYIAYGAEIHSDEDENHLVSLGLEKDGYYMVMARMEPENNIGMILEGFSASRSARKLLVVGNPGNTYGRGLVSQYGGDSRILFAGAIYDARKLHSLKIFSSLYFHGHSVGGTNPSLLEAMASRALIAAHDNPFNKAILGEDALYFSSAAQTTELVNRSYDEPIRRGMIEHNLQKIHDHFNWETITDEYERFLQSSLDGFIRKKR